jgi:hypothetical protein
MQRHVGYWVNTGSGWHRFDMTRLTQIDRLLRDFGAVQHGERAAIRLTQGDTPRS